MNLFAGKLASCNDPEVSHRSECIGQFLRFGFTTERVWSNPRCHFDNILAAMHSLVIIMFRFVCLLACWRVGLFLLSLTCNLLHCPVDNGPQ